AVEFNVDAGCASFFDCVDRFPMKRPVLRTDGLEMRDLQAASGTAGELQLLLDGRQQFIRITADVTGIDFVFTSDDAAQVLELGGGSAAPGRVHETGGET